MFSRCIFLLPLLVHLVLSFNLASLSVKEKQELCQKNSQHCNDFCLFKVRSNVCNRHSLYFTCVCQSPHIQPVKNLFPIQVNQCNGDISECQNDCSFDFTFSSWEANECSSRCILNYSCGTPFSQEDIVFAERVPSLVDDGTVQMVPKEPKIPTVSRVPTVSRIPRVSRVTNEDQTEERVTSEPVRSRVTSEPLVKSEPFTEKREQRRTFLVPAETKIEPTRTLFPSRSREDLSRGSIKTSTVEDSVETRITTETRRTIGPLPSGTPGTAADGEKGTTVPVEEEKPSPTTIVVNVNAPEGPSEVNYIPVSGATSSVVDPCIKAFCMFLAVFLSTMVHK
jgi:hypothetical protein